MSTFPTLLDPQLKVFFCRCQASKHAASKAIHLTQILQTERIIDFDEADTMTFNYLKQYNLLHHIQPERHFVNTNESLISMFIGGYGYGVLAAELCQPYLENNELITLNSGLAYENKMLLAWYGRTEQPHYFSDVIEAIN